MSRKLSTIVLLSLLLAVFFALNASAKQSADQDVWKYREYLTRTSKAKLAGAEHSLYYTPPQSEGASPLGFNGVDAASPGIEVGITTHDFQHNGRGNRQIDWRNTQVVHIIWFKQTDFIAGGDGGTGYEAFDPLMGDFIFKGTGGGCDIHPRLGSGVNFSGYIGLDVDTEGKAVIVNHHDEGAGYGTTVWYDFDELNCFFSPYKRRLPDTTMQYGVPPDQITSGEYLFVWPVMEYQVWDGDTITHVVAHQLENEIDESFIHYFRRIGSDTVGYWDYPPVIIDTVPCIGETVVASRVSEKVSLVWLAPPGAYPGDPESMDRDWIDPGLGVNQRTNDVYYMSSDDMGATWGPKTNISAYDSTTGGYLAHSDLSALIDTQDRLHVLWDARVIDPTGDEGGLGTYTYFWGSRLLHWDEFNNEVRTVKDANWNIADEAINDSTCTGGAWNEMSIVKPQLSECDGKFYALFVQFLDLDNGLYNDCAALRWEGAGYRGTANGELYIAVSDNGGYNWDIARNLTNTPTPLCDTGVAATLPCESDQWPAMSRYGMQTDPGGDWDIVSVVDPSGGYSGDMFLDVMYVNDKFPGGSQQDAGIWTTNPVLWFRVPCVEPIPNPVLVYSPSEINQPTWTKPGVQLTDTVLLENVGNAPLYISSISTIEINGTAGWLGTSTTGDITISHLSPNFDTFELYLNAGGAITVGPAVVEGYVIIESDAVGGSTDSISVELIVADTVQFPDEADIRTTCTRLVFNNAGNIGGSGGDNGNGGYNLNFFDDCDTTQNVSGADDHAGVYLYDGSPFICYDDGGEVVFNYYAFDASWLTSDGFRPLVSPFADSSTYQNNYQYGYSGQFVSNDSNIALECEYFAPDNNPDSCSFIVMKQRIINISENTYSNVFYGDAIDWDIPSDSGSENSSDFDAPRMLMYCYGAEYDADSIENNDCVLADQRLGGLAYYGGFKLPHYDSTTDRYYAPRAMWTRMNADYVYPEGGLVADEMYTLLNSITGYSPWEAVNPTAEDSAYQDLHMIAVFAQRDLTPGDTMVFVKILTSTYQGLMDMQMNVDAAREWIEARPEIFSYPEESAPLCCCDVAGDASDNGLVNILDVTYIINYLYKSGPIAPCPAEADANGNCQVNILDVTYIINYLYKSGPAPICPDASCDLCIP